MNTDHQLHQLAATGWRRGLYADIQATFRAPFVNWIWRTATANEPAFTRFAWGQVKPLFETRAFAELSVAYRNAVLGALEADAAVPTYRRPEASVSPAEYAELRGQLATFDIVAPRLAVLFETMDRALHGGNIGTEPRTDEAATALFPDGLDRDRGRPPSMVDDVPDAAAETAARLRTFHGFDATLPSIYRCLLQWPGFAEHVWDDLEPQAESAAFERAVDRTNDLVDEFVRTAPYRPQLAPDTLRAAGFEDTTVDGARELFQTFNTGPVETVLPMLPILAATVRAEGRRSL